MTCLYLKVYLCICIIFDDTLVVDAPEQVIVFLVGHLDGHLLALLDHLLLAVCPLHLLTLHTSLHGAHGAALGPALLLLNRLKVGLGHAVIAFVHLNLLLNLLVHQPTVLPADVLAVLVAGKHLLAGLVDLPLGVALLLGHSLAVGRLLGLL